MRHRIDRPSSRPFEIEFDRIGAFRSIYVCLLLYCIIVYDICTRSIYETRPCGENPNAMHACV
jgi:hypothetical protein